MSNKLCIITGSTLGNAEYLAESIQQQLSIKEISSMLFHGPMLSEVMDYNHWLIITSTHGAGELPDNLQPLFNEIETTHHNFDLLHYTVIGLGSSDYDTFCFAVDKIEQKLKMKKAYLFYPFIKIDTKFEENHEIACERWLTGYIEQIKPIFCE